MTDFYRPEAGESAPPVPTGPALCDGTDMRLVHNMFLFAYGEVPGLIRGTPAGDTARAEFIGRWIDDWDASLHTHHETEDLLLWDRLEQRAPACALHVGQMRVYHAKVAELLGATAPLLAEWRRTAGRDAGEQAAVAYDALLDVLKVHLRREVVEVIPVAERVITGAEWEELGRHGMDGIPRDRLLIQLGYVISSSPPDLVAGFRRQIPLPVRLLYTLTGRRQFERQFQELFPGRPVPRT